MNEAKIHYDLFISLDCFFEEFSNRYYNKVVTSYENFHQLNSRLKKMKQSPNIFVILDGKTIEESLSFNVKALESYEDLIKYLS